MSFQYSHAVTWLAYEGAGQRLVAGTVEPSIVAWDAATGREDVPLSGQMTAALQKSSLKFGGPVATHFEQARFSGKQLLAIAHADFVKLFDLSTMAEARTLAGHLGSVEAVAFSRHADSLATADSDGTIRLWEVATGRNTRILPWHQGTVRGMSFSPDGRWFISAGDQVLTLWDVGPDWDCRVLPLHTNGVYGLSFSADGRLLASGGGEGRDPRTAQIGQVRVIESETGRLVFSVDVPEGFGVVAVALSPDGSTIAAGGRGNWVKIWDVATGELRLALDQVGLQVRQVRNLQFTPDGERLLIAGESHSIIWDLATGADPRPTHEPFSAAGYAVFSPDGEAVFGRSGRGLLGVNAATGERLFAIGDLPASWRLAASPDGALLAIGFDNRRFPPDRKNEFAQIRSAAAGASVRVLRGDPKRSSADYVSSTYGVSFSADSRRVATASGDKTVRIWDVATGDELLVFPHPNDVFCVAFSPDGRWLASGSGHWTGPRPGEVRLWDARTRPVPEMID